MCNLLAGAAVHGTRNLSPGRGFLAGRDGTVRLGGVPAAIGMAQRAPATPPARNPRRGLLSTTPPSRKSPRRPESPSTHPICRTHPTPRTTRSRDTRETLEFRVYSSLPTANRLSWPYKPCLASSVSAVGLWLFWNRLSGNPLFSVDALQCPRTHVFISSHILPRAHVPLTG